MCLRARVRSVWRVKMTRISKQSILKRFAFFTEMNPPKSGGSAKLVRPALLPSRRMPMDLRGGPAQARRVCSEASSVARVGSPLSTGRARGHDSAPAVVVPAFLSPRCAPARGWQMRGSARAAKGGSRDVPPPTPHCARTAGRATHAARAQTGMGLLLDSQGGGLSHKAPQGAICW